MLVDAAWNDLTAQTSTSGEWGNPGLAIAPVRRGATNAEAPQGIEGNIQTEVERLADSDPTYTAKSSTWLIQQLRGAGATNIEAILQPDRREQLRGYLRTAEVGIQYILIPTMRVTFFEENNRYVYSLTLERVDIESEHGSTVRGRGEVTAGS